MNAVPKLALMGRSTLDGAEMPVYSTDTAKPYVEVADGIVDVRCEHADGRRSLLRLRLVQGAS